MDMADELPKLLRDLRHLDPEVRKERVKVAANAASAIGLALLIGSLVAPIVDATRPLQPGRASFGLAAGVFCLIAAAFILRYIKAKETS
ncbi:MAG: hypothetical protein ACOY4K_15700 [Pseudomonadota bacterium]